METDGRNALYDVKELAESFPSVPLILKSSEIFHRCPTAHRRMHHGQYAVERSAVLPGLPARLFES